MAYLNETKRTQESPHPMYGIRPGFNIADLCQDSGGVSTAALTNVTVATVSAAFKGGRYLFGQLITTDPAVSVSVDLYTWNGTTATKIYTTPNVTLFTQEIPMTGFNGIDLQGGQFKLGISNVVNPNTANISLNFVLNG